VTTSPSFSVVGIHNVVTESTCEKTVGAATAAPGTISRPSRRSELPEDSDGGGCETVTVGGGVILGEAGTESLVVDGESDEEEEEEEEEEETSSAAKAAAESARRRRFDVLIVMVGVVSGSGEQRTSMSKTGLKGCDRCE